MPPYSPMALAGPEHNIRFLERGMRTPTITTFLAIADVMGVDHHIFLDDVIMRMAQLEHGSRPSTCCRPIPFANIRRVFLRFLLAKFCIRS